MPVGLVLPPARAAPEEAAEAEPAPAAPAPRKAPPQGQRKGWVPRSQADFACDMHRRFAVLLLKKRQQRILELL